MIGPAIQRSDKECSEGRLLSAMKFVQREKVIKEGLVELSLGQIQECLKAAYIPLCLGQREKILNGGYGPLCVDQKKNALNGSCILLSYVR